MTEEKPKRAKKEEKALKNVQVNDNAVLIGKKPVMNYVIACLTYFNSGSSKVVVKARGMSISRAVDTVELLRRAFVKGAQPKEIAIGTVEVTRGDGRKANVSTIEITVAK
jgi:DNA-binding protein Alba